MRTLIFVLVFILVFDPYPVDNAQFEVKSQYEALGLISANDTLEVHLQEDRVYAFLAVARAQGRFPSLPSLPLFAFWIGETSFPDTIRVNSYLDRNLNGYHDLEDLAFFADTLSVDLSLFASFAEDYYKPCYRIYVKSP